MAANNSDPASNQLKEWYKENKDKIRYVKNDTGIPLVSQSSSITVSKNGSLSKYATMFQDKIRYVKNDTGIPLVSQSSSITVSKNGSIVLRDWNLLEQLGHFSRERIPERVVHAKGAGAFGYFEVTHDITRYTVSKVFERIGKRTPLAVRFSQVTGNMGSADTVRDSRGFALKFYTEEGVWDLVGNNTPIFFIKDPILFPVFQHAQRRNPVTNLKDWNMVWDWFTLTPESVHQVMILYSDRGIPDGHRHQDGFGSHTFSLINKNRELTWVKFIYKTDQGIKNLDNDTAAKIAGDDPDYAVRDLYNAIESGNYPTWTFYIQTMTPEQAKQSSFNPFDITKVWPQKEYPLIPVGKIVLNKNPSNYFAEVEQLAFNPNNITPGIGDSPDRLLQGRLFSYQDTHRYRLGVNYQQLPVNKSFTQVDNYQRDGQSTIYNQGGAPNYYPNSFGGPETHPNSEQWSMPPQKLDGYEDHYDIGSLDNYSQPRNFWNNVLNADERSNMVANIASTVKLTSKEIQKRVIRLFSNVDETFGNMLEEKLNVVHLRI